MPFESGNCRYHARLVFKLARAKAAVPLCAAVFLGDGVLAAEADRTGTDGQTSEYLDVGGSKIYYETRGSGPAAIILLHDGLLSSVIWDEVWRPLAKKYHVIRYDRRGYGRSELPSTSYSSTEDLVKLLAHLKVQHALLVGSSSGGALAIDFAIEHPQMVDGLFLIGPVLHGMRYSKDFVARANRNNEPMERDDVRAMARNWSQDRYLIAGANEAARQKIYEQLVENGEKLKKFDSTLEQKLSPPASERLGEIKAPTLIIMGQADIADVRAHCGAINAGIRGSTREFVKDAGHLIQLEKPDEVAKRIEEFAQRCERQPAR